MKTLSSLLLVAPVVCIAQTPSPVITFENTSHDFGKIGVERKVSHRFKVTNTGNATLNITKINPSCGCTSTVLGKWSLAPGESTEVEASFDPKGFQGKVHKSIQVISDDPAHSTVTLTFEAEVIQEIMPSTKALFFYEILRSTSKSATVRLVSGNGKPVQVKETKAPGAPYLSATVKNEGNDAIVDVSVDGRKISPGKMRGVDAMTVVTTSEKMPIITINVQWEMKPSVVATPEQVVWSEMAGKALKMPVSLNQSQGKAFKIKEYRCSNPLITIEGIGKNDAAKHDLQVVFSPSAKIGNYHENVIFFLDDPEQPEFTLKVTAMLR